MKTQALLASAAMMLAAFTTSMSAAEETAETAKLEAKSVELRRDLVEVTPRVFVAVGFSPANVSFIVGRTGLVVIDTGMSPKHAREILEAFRPVSDLPVEAIIYTHGHGDHTGGASAFAEAAQPEIWARSNLNEEGRGFASAGLTINQLRGARQAGFRLPKEKRINNGIALPFQPDRTDAFSGSTSGFLPPATGLHFLQDRFDITPGIGAPRRRKPA